MVSKCMSKLNTTWQATIAKFNIKGSGEVRLQFVLWFVKFNPDDLYILYLRNFGLHLENYKRYPTEFN